MTARHLESVMRTVRVGILGAAKIAPKALIAPARDNPEFRVVAVAARDKGRAKIFAEENGIPFVADGYSALIARDDIDLVYNALPPAGHLPWSIEAVKSGKAVLCEKPFSLTASQARMMVSAAAEAKQPLIEAFHYRFHKILRRAFAIAASGELGQLIDAEAMFDAPIAYRPNELRWIVTQGGGALMDLGCYCVHALRTLAGEPKIKRATCTVEHGVDAVTRADLVFPNGMTARLGTSMKAEFRATLRVMGEKGSLDISNFLAPQMGCRFTVKIDGKSREEPVEGPSTYAAQLAHVGDVLLRGAVPLTGGTDAIANMACIEAIYAAAGFKRPFET